MEAESRKMQIEAAKKGFSEWLETSLSDDGSDEFIADYTVLGGSVKDAEQELMDFFEFLDDRESFFECYPKFVGYGE